LAFVVFCIFSPEKKLQNAAKIMFLCPLGAESSNFEGKVIEKETKHNYLSVAVPFCGSHFLCKPRQISVLPSGGWFGNKEMVQKAMQPRYESRVPDITPPPRAGNLDNLHGCFLQFSHPLISI
jgi:hypothetical protein